jgi:hypothetical protein
MKTIMRMFTKDEDQKLRIFIDEVNRNEELKAREYENRSTYVNPGALRNGIRREKMFYTIQFNDYCPV